MKCENDINEQNSKIEYNLLTFGYVMETIGVDGERYMTSTWLV